MNTLGQLKVMLEMQALRGFSGQSITSDHGSGSSLFQELLQQSLVQQEAPSTSSLEQSDHRYE